MQALQDLETFEIEVLELLNSIKILDNLSRYSTDLDFWLAKKEDPKVVFHTIKRTLSDNYKLTDSANKKFTLLFEIKTSSVNRSLKIEIRKEQVNFDWERKIAFSTHTNKQIMIKGLTLQQMMKNKIDALLSRKLIRDAFDIEFLLMRGVESPKDKSKLEPALQIINNFKEQEYKVTLGSILDENDRKYYLVNRFKFLKEELTRMILTPL
jgi:hypothetical protein